MATTPIGVIEDAISVMARMCHDPQVQMGALWMPFRDAYQGLSDLRDALKEGKTQLPVHAESKDRS